MSPPGGKRLASLALALCSSAGLADELRFSAFGTVGYAISNNAYRYQRFIDSDGTLVRDSRFGVQLDADLAPTWRATVQARLAPSADDDKAWAVDLPWAFLSWRPNNDWLVRIGKTRVAALLYAENMDVGTTYAFARLPVEVYSIAPTQDLYGVALTRSWLGQSLDVDLDGFAGWGHAAWRAYFRDPLPGEKSRPGSWFEGFGGPMASATLTLRQGDNRFRVNASAWDIRLDSRPYLTSYPYVALAPGVGYYQVDGALPGPGVKAQRRTHNYAASAGAEFALPAGLQSVAELVWRGGDQINTGAGTHSTSGYLAFLRPTGRWTPYAYGAWMRSSAYARRLEASLNATQLPDYVPGAAIVNTLQRNAADAALVVDQRTWAVGTSYAAGSGQLLKLEWQRTLTGQGSAFLDTPLGVERAHQRVGVVSFSYNFAF